MSSLNKTKPLPSVPVTPELKFSDGEFLTAKGTKIYDELKSLANVKLTKGRVQAVFGFGDMCSEIEAVECKDLKTMKADAFIICSNLFLVKQQIDMKVYAPILRVPTDLIARHQEKVSADILKGSSLMLSQRVELLRVLNGSCSALTLDTLPVVGRSSRYLNLFYLIGFSSTNLSFRMDVTRLLAEQVIQHEIALREGSSLDTRHVINEFSPHRFNI